MSLGLALMLGTAGLPHILMRFYTVPDARTARTSVGYATAFIGFFYLLTFILGFGAMVIIGRDAITAIDAGGNMAAPLLAEAVGGTPFLGLHFGGRLCHDSGRRRGPHAVRRGDAVTRSVGERGARREGRSARATAGRAQSPQCCWRSSRSCSGVAFKGQNVAYMVGLAFAIAASANFPALVLSIFWSRLTTAGAQSSMIVGTVAALLLIYFSPTIQVDILHNTERVVPASKSGHRLDPAVVRRRDRRLAPVAGVV